MSVCNTSIEVTFIHGITQVFNGLNDEYALHMMRSYQQYRDRGGYVAKFWANVEVDRLHAGRALYELRFGQMRDIRIV